VRLSDVMSGMEPHVIHRVSAFDLVVEPWAWPFAAARRAEIDAHFAEKQREKPATWNGRVLLGRNLVFSGGRLSASYFETDFASFLAWRDWGFPDRSVFNGFGMGALRCADGAFVLGEMGQHTSNAGRIYFPSGTPDLNDIRDGRVDIAGSVTRELEEETGLKPGEYESEPHWHCVYTGPAVAMIRILRVDMPAEALRRRIERNLAAQRQPELSAVHLVRGTNDLNSAMPRFVTAFIEAQLASKL
jgi:8-oxo-dGTP pyrophosphatase MutT (NUDIX family)